jgi:hypothetical protein
MAKKDKKDIPVASQPATPISRRGWKTIGIGIGIVILGFVVLSFTDPRGQNFASHLSPFLILGGYTTIGFGILLKDPA